MTDLPTVTTVIAIESLDTRVSEVRDQLAKLTDYVGEGPSEPQMNRLCEAVEYLGFVKFQELMLTTAERLVPGKGTKPHEDAVKQLIESLLRKVFPPPFEKRLRATFAASRIDVEETVDDAMSAEKAGGDVKLQEAARTLMTPQAWKLMGDLTRRTDRGPGELLEEALGMLTAKEASDSLRGERTPPSTELTKEDQEANRKGDTRDERE